MLLNCDGQELLKIPWTARRSKQSILKEINPEYSLEGLMLNLKLQYFGCLMWRADSLEKTLILEKVENRRRSGQQRMRWLDGIADSMDMDLGELQVTVRGREAWHAAVYAFSENSHCFVWWLLLASLFLLDPTWNSPSENSLFSGDIQKQSEEIVKYSDCLRW